MSFLIIMILICSCDKDKGISRPPIDEEVLIDEFSPVLTISLDADFNDFMNNYDENFGNFIDNLTSIINCEYDDIIILSVMEGSVNINFQILVQYYDSLINSSDDELSEALGYEVQLINDECDLNNIDDDLDSDGICDTFDDCIGEYDICGVCNGSGLNNMGCCSDTCYDNILESSGISNHITFLENLDAVLEPGDIIGIFDIEGISSSSCFLNFSDLSLVGVGVWEGVRLTITMIGSYSTCSYPNGFQIPGYIDNNDIIVRIYRPSEDTYYDTVVSFSVGSNTFGQGYYEVNDLDLIIP